MRARKQVFTACALPFVIGLLASVRLALGNANCHATPEQQPSASAAPAHQQFTLITLADGTFEGAHGTFKTYKAQDGAIVWLILIHRQAAQDAKQIYDAVKRRASKVIREDHAVDPSGLTTDKAVLTIPDRDGKKALTAIITASGPEFLEVESYSSPDALAFESLVKP